MDFVADELAAAVGIPAGIPPAQVEAASEAAASRMGRSPYGVTQGDQGGSGHERPYRQREWGHKHPIVLPWQAIEKPQTGEYVDAEELNPLVT